MKPEQLAVICRCDHARRDHQTGTIFVQYLTNCFVCNCHYFEPQADLLIQRVKRDAAGRFTR